MKSDACRSDRLPALDGDGLADTDDDGDTEREADRLAEEEGLVEADGDGLRLTDGLGDDDVTGGGYRIIGRCGFFDILANLFYNKNP